MAQNDDFRRYKNPNETQSAPQRSIADFHEKQRAAAMEAMAAGGQLAGANTAQDARILVAMVDELHRVLAGIEDGIYGITMAHCRLMNPRAIEGKEGPVPPSPVSPDTFEGKLESALQRAGRIAHEAQAIAAAFNRAV